MFPTTYLLYGEALLVLDLAWPRLLSPLHSVFIARLPTDCFICYYKVSHSGTDDDSQILGHHVLYTTILEQMFRTSLLQSIFRSFQDEPILGR